MIDQCLPNPFFGKTGELKSSWNAEGGTLGAMKKHNRSEPEKDVPLHWVLLIYYYNYYCIYILIIIININILYYNFAKLETHNDSR